MNDEANRAPFIFEMPIDRILDETEIIPLVLNGVRVQWIKCSFCAKEGWTSDERMHCSVLCFCKAKGIDKKKMGLIRYAVIVNNAAFKDDLVEYGGQQLQVVATDCTAERIKRSYHLRFNYVLRWKDQLIQVNDSETPLQRQSGRSFFGEEEHSA